MSTSGSTTWELTRNQIIEAALRKLGVLDKNESADSTDLTNGTIALNGIITRFNTLGMPLWKRVEASITLVNGTQSYTVNNALKMPAVYLRNTGSSTTYELELKSEYDLLKLPYNSNGSVPTAWSYTPNINEGGTIKIWPTPNSTAAGNYTLYVVYQKEFDTFTSSGETPDFPSYWTDALIYALAVSLAPEKGLPLNDRIQLKQEAKEYLEQAKGYSDEDGSVFFQPYYSTY